MLQKVLTVGVFPRGASSVHERETRQLSKLLRCHYLDLAAEALIKPIRIITYIYTECIQTIFPIKETPTRSRRAA